MPSSRTHFRINWHSSPSPSPSVSGSPASTSRKWGWENSHPTPVLWALELLRALFSPHCSSPCTQVAAHLKTPPPSSWSLQTTPHWSASFRMAQQRLYFLQQLRKFNLPQELLRQFYSAIIESVLRTSMTVWFSSATKSDLRRLRRVARTAERIIDTTLPTLQKLYSSRVRKRSGKIPLDPSHPAHSLFELLPSGRRYRALSTRTTRHRKFLSPSSHEYLILNMEHTTILYNYLFTTQTFLFQICTCQTSHIIVCIVYCVFAILYMAYIVYCYFVVCVLSCHCPSVALWSFYHYNKFLMCKHTWPIKLILILLKL